MAFADSYIKNQIEMYENSPTTCSFIKILGANHLSFSTIVRLVPDVSPNVTKTIRSNYFISR